MNETQTSLAEVYERSLAVEDPQARKAAGAYYSPKHLVDYIVHTTLGKLCKGKEPDEVARIKVLDPACGGGLFLLQAYQYLLDWHQKCLLRELTEEERLQVLLNAIRGVDIDATAVELTKISLLALTFGEEKGGTTEHEAAWTKLGKNIVCGNALVGTDFYDNPKTNALCDQQREAIAPMDWKTIFPDVFAAGGFNCVIGNPPYNNYSARNSLLAYYAKEGMTEQLQSLTLVNAYCLEKYAASSHRVREQYKWFLEKSFHLLHADGKLGMIIPETFEKLVGYADARALFDGKYRFQHCGFGKFADATVATGILLFPFTETDAEATQLAWDLDNCELLGDCVVFREGEHIPRQELVEDAQHVPVIDSKGMRPWFLVPPTRYYPENGIYKVTEGERLVVRKTGYEIVAALTDQRAYVIQNLYQSIVCNKYSTQYLLALLNSRFASWYYRHVLTPNSGGVFSQLRLLHLKKLPIPKASNEEQSQVTELAQRILNERNQKKLALLNDQINRLVYSLYKLTDEQIYTMEKNDDRK